MEDTVGSQFHVPERKTRGKGRQCELLRFETLAGLNPFDEVYTFGSVTKPQPVPQVPDVDAGFDNLWIFRHFLDIRTPMNAARRKVALALFDVLRLGESSQGQFQKFSRTNCAQC